MSIFPAIVHKSAGNCRFGHNYEEIVNGKLPFMGSDCALCTCGKPIWFVEK